MTNKIFNSILISTLVLTTFSCKAQLVTQLTNEQQFIIGTWVHENEPENVWQFTSNGICYWKDENNNIEATFNYSISYTSPQCGYDVQVNENQLSYLKLIDQEDNDTYCYEILGVDDESLSISTIGLSVRYSYFNKE